ncbi:TatD family deoxyribonuclease, partial [Clostridium perfringens]
MKSFTQSEANLPLLDTHIHLDSYSLSDQQAIL